MSQHAGTAESYLSKLTSVLAQLDRQQIDNAIEVIADAWRMDRQVIAFGNGGSAMTALHFINDWNKAILTATNKRFRGRTLVDNLGLVTSFANDCSFESIFLGQLKNVLDPGDLVIAISSSGNSENVIRAVEYANDFGAITLGLCGFEGGRLKNVAQHVLWVNVNDTQLSEDVHSIFGHILVQRLCSLCNSSREPEAAVGGAPPTSPVLASPVS
jgi:D-sedoheptulose 7-phosphate isomerase